MPMNERMAGSAGSGAVPHNSTVPLEAWSNDVPAYEFTPWDDDAGEPYACAALSYVRDARAWNLRIMWSCRRFGNGS